MTKFFITTNVLPHHCLYKSFSKSLYSFSHKFTFTSRTFLLKPRTLSSSLILAKPCSLTSTMASSSSVPRFPEDIPINIYAQDSYLKDATMNLRFEESKLVMERPIDFEALKVNGHDYKDFFTEQGWGHYLDMLNGPIYSNLVFDFWRKSEVVTLVDVNAELQRVIDQNPSENKGKSREELGLRKFTKTEIRSSAEGFQLRDTLSTSSPQKGK